MPRRLSLTVVLAPVLRRRSRALVSLLALALGACLMTTLLTLYRSVPGAVSRQFRRFGANLVVTPPPGRTTFPLAAAHRLLAAYPSAAGLLYDVVAASGRPVVLVGADPARLRALNPSWRIRGPLPASGEAWLGVNAARLLGAGPGAWITVTAGGRTARWRVAGTVSAGGSVDSQIFAPYAQVAALGGVAGYTTLQLRVPPNPAAMHAAVRQVRAALPGAVARPVREIARGELAILLRTQSLMLTTSALILLTVELCCAATLTTLALERQRDFGLMKALGGGDAAIMSAFVAEAALIGGAAALPGAAAGVLLAGALGRSLFGVWVPPSFSAAVAAIVCTVLLAAAAALLPWPVVRDASPAAMLRGDWGRAAS